MAQQDNNLSTQEKLQRLELLRKKKQLLELKAQKQAQQTKPDNVSREAFAAKSRGKPLKVVDETGMNLFPESGPGGVMGSIGSAGLLGGMGGPSRFLEGFGQGLVSLGRGFEQNVINRFTDVPAEEKAALQKKINQAETIDKPLLGTPGGFFGSLAAKSAPFALFGGGTGGLLAGGGTSGFLEPRATGDPSAGMNALQGAIAAPLTAGLFKKGGQFVENQANKLVNFVRGRPNVKNLVDEGVELTPGQLLGGTVERAEEVATSKPVIGEAIRELQDKGIKSFNRTIANKVLEPLGETAESVTSRAGTVGRELVDDVSNRVSKAYDDILESVDSSITMPLTSGLRKNIRKIRLNARSLADADQKRIKNIIENDVLRRFKRPNIRAGDKARFDEVPTTRETTILKPGAGNETFKAGGKPNKVPRQEMTPRTFKKMHSKLRQRSRDFMKSGDPDKIEMGMLLNDLQQDLFDEFKKAFPDKAGPLNAVDLAYKRLLPFQTAAGKTGAKEGVFTPSQFSSALRSADKSKTKANFARGRMDLQDISDSAKSVLSPKLNESGTAPRSSFFDVLRSPAGIAGTLGGARLIKSPALTNALTGKTQPIQNLGRFLQRVAPVAGAGAGIGVTRE